MMDRTYDKIRKEAGEALESLESVKLLAELLPDSPPAYEKISIKRFADAAELQVNRIILKVDEVRPRLTDKVLDSVPK